MSIINPIVAGISAVAILMLFFSSGAWIGERHGNPSVHCVDGITYYAFNKGSQIHVGIAIDQTIDTINCKEA